MTSSERPSRFSPTSARPASPVWLNVRWILLLGDASRIPTGRAAPRIYLTYMHLFGDPSLRVW